MMAGRSAFCGKPAFLIQKHVASRDFSCRKKNFQSHLFLFRSYFLNPPSLFFLQRNIFFYCQKVKKSWRRDLLFFPGNFLALQSPSLNYLVASGVLLFS